MALPDDDGRDNFIGHIASPGAAIACGMMMPLRRRSHATMSFDTMSDFSRCVHLV